MGRWLALGCGLSLAIAGCSDGKATEPAGEVSGHWCGAQVATAAECIGDEVIYLNLGESGDLVTGQACEAYAMGCEDVQAGRVTGSQFTFYYTFGTPSERVDGTFTLQDPATLSGSYRSTKCNCDIPVTLHRLP